MNEHRESQTTGSGTNPPVDSHVATFGAGATGRSGAWPAIAIGPVSRTTLRARLALLRPRALKVQPATAARP
jgi:hypothetical protein